MRIAQVAPLYESVPPKTYGGTERVVSYLTEELVSQGHEVTLFASGDSETKAHLVSPCRRSLRLDPKCLDPLVPHILMLEQIAKYNGEFDIVHFHIDYLHYHWSRRQSTPHLTTLHGRLDSPHLIPLYQEFDDIPVVSISNSQRKPLSWIDWRATVYHGLPEHLYRFQDSPGKCLVFLGRVSPEKGVDDAIEIAKRAGKELKIAAKVDRVDQEYFEQTIKPLLRQPHVEFLGEVGQKEKDVLLGQALALLMPVNWPEPFGLVMIESLACGTPVIAYSRGSVPEIIEDGVTGIIVRNLEEAAHAVEKIPGLSRAMCRKVFEERFSASRMARDYIAVFSRLVADSNLAVGPVRKMASPRNTTWTRSFG